jgi:hypothetical protein
MWLIDVHEKGIADAKMDMRGHLLGLEILKDCKAQMPQGLWKPDGFDKVDMDGINLWFLCMHAYDIESMTPFGKVVRKVPAVPLRPADRRIELLDGNANLQKYFLSRPSLPPAAASGWNIGSSARGRPPLPVISFYCFNDISHLIIPEPGIHGQTEDLAHPAIGVFQHA